MLLIFVLFLFGNSVVECYGWYLRNSCRLQWR